MDLEVGRKPGYSYTGRDEPGKNHTIYVSDPSWKNIKAMAHERGMSISLFIDSIGAGKIKLAEQVTTTNDLPTEITKSLIPENLIQDPSAAAAPPISQSESTHNPVDPFIKD